MRYDIPIQDFEEMIAKGLWVGHRFVCKGQTLVLTSIGQRQIAEDGTGVVPVDIVAEQSADVLNRLALAFL